MNPTLEQVIAAITPLWGSQPLVLVPPVAPVVITSAFGPSTAVRQHATLGIRAVSPVRIDSTNGWVVDFDVPQDYDHILRLVVAEASGGPGVKHVDILNEQGVLVASGDAHPGTVTIYVDTGNHGYGYPSAPSGHKYYVVLTVPTQDEYDLAFFDSQTAL